MFGIKVCLKTVPLLNTLVRNTVADRDPALQHVLDLPAEPHIRHSFYQNIRFNSHHSASDIDTDGRREDGVSCSDHSADRHSVAYMAIRHQCHMAA